MDDLLTEIRDDILIVTMNRLQARNAINGAIFSGIATALARLDADPALRVAILTGAGGHFCSGMDLKAFAKGDTPAGGGNFKGIVPATQKPLIAAVDGYALAGGFELLLFCDLVVAAHDARFGIPEVKRGLAAAGGGLTALPDLIPYRLALELALTGEMIDAARARDLGLVNRLVEGPALDGALALARVIADNAPLAVRRSKAIMSQSRDWPRAERFARQGAELGALFASHDAREGAVAFAEKRKPVWKGE